MKKYIEMEAFLREAVGVSEGGFLRPTCFLGGRSWCSFEVSRHRGFEATRRQGQEVSRHVVGTLRGHSASSMGKYGRFNIK